MVSELLNYQSWKMGFEELERGFEGPPLYDTYPDEEDTEPGDATSETEELEKEKDCIAGECYSGDDEPKWDSDDEEPLWEETTLAESSPALPENDTVTVEVKPESETLMCSRNRSKQCSFLVTEECDLDVEKAKSRLERTLGETDLENSDEEPPPEEPPPAEVSPTTMMSSELERTAAAMSCGRELKEKEIRVGWELKERDRVIISLGQAQFQVSNFDPFVIKRGVSIVIAEKDKKLIEFGCFQKKLDFTSNPMGQAHSFINTPPIFANNRRALQVEEEMDQKKFIGSDWAESQYLSMNFTTNASVFEFVSAPKIEMENMKILFPTNIEYRGTNIHERCEVKEVGVNTPIIVEYPVVHEWDPGGFIRDGWNPSGIRRDVNIQENGNTNAMEVPGNQIHENLEVLLNFQQLIDFVGDYGDAFMSSKMLKSHVIIAFPFNNEERWLQEAKGIENKRVHQSTLLVGINYGVGGEGTQIQDQFINTSVILLKLSGLSIKDIKQPCCALSFSLINDIAIWGSYNSIDPYKTSARVHDILRDGDAFGICLVEVVVSLFHSMWKGFLENYLVFNDMYTPVTQAKEPLLLVLSNLIFLNNLVMRTTGDDLVVLPNGKEMQVQVYVVESYVGGNDFWATSLVEICKKCGQESNREYELVAATLMCGYFTILIRQWEPGQLDCPRTTTGYKYHWLVFFNFIGSLNCVFDIGSSSVSCIVWVSCFKLWDPGGRPLSLVFFRYLHLEDKVNFKGGSIDENLALPNRIGKVCSRRGRIGINYRIRYLGGKSCNNLAESASGNVLSEVHTFGVS